VTPAVLRRSTIRSAADSTPRRCPRWPGVSWAAAVGHSVHAW